MKTTFITTVFNETKTIEKFLDSLLSQTTMPDEIIIVDGGSTDNTLDKIKKGKEKFKKAVVLKVFVKKGNRSVGRNEAIKRAKGDIILCSDAGNILDKNWIRNILKPFGNKKVSSKERGIDVVAGYYKGIAKNSFQKSLIPYVLVMPDKVNPSDFLPATRSIAFRKSIWEKVDGFDERYSHNEDYVFANKLKAIGAKIVFAKDAIVYWIPRSTVKEAFIMFFRFALGDAESGLWRTKVLLLFARYILGFYFLFLSLLFRSFTPLAIVLVGFIGYFIWSVRKNYKYVGSIDALWMLPFIQLMADCAVLFGTSVGVIKKIINFHYVSYLKNNKFLAAVLLIYAAILMLTLHWGIPNENHPFPYHMDEWHQLQAVANTFRHGTPNTFGSANGTMFHFIYSGFYLVPVTVFGIVDPFSLQLDNAFMRQRIFEVLRIQTIIFGLLSIFTLYKIAETLNFPKRTTIALFTFTPIWLSLSNFFKYDIALAFWILLSFYFMLRFSKQANNRNFILAAIPTALAVSVKISALPLLMAYILSYFLFHPFWRKNFQFLAWGLLLFTSVLLLFGMPDTLFGKGNIGLYLFENVVIGPSAVTKYDLDMHPLVYVLTNHYPMLLGHGGFVFYVSALLISIILIIKEFRNHKSEFFILCTWSFFFISLLFIGIEGVGNRVFVIIPFFVLLTAFVIKKLSEKKNLKSIVLTLVTIIFIFQLIESFMVLHMKLSNPPQETSSVWIKENIKKGETIGLENIPIYQGVPDIVLKEFYFSQYRIAKDNLFTYEIITDQTKKLPETVIISNDQLYRSVLKDSSKERVVNRLVKEKYQKVAEFTQDESLYKLLYQPRDYYFYSLMFAGPQTISVYQKK